MLFVITNSQLCRDNFLNRIDEIASAKPDRIILREKHLSYDELFDLAKCCLNICYQYNVPFSVNSNIDIASKLSADIHLPYSIFIKNYDILLSNFKTVGVSVHNTDEAVTSEKLGASYLIAGHIFATDCKKGLEPKGLNYLSDISKSVKIPVLGIGGITAERIGSVMNVGASGVCIMSHFMICDNPAYEILQFKTIQKNYIH